MASIAETSRPESIDPGKVETGEDPTVFNSVLETLSKHEIPFKRMSHRPTLTSEEVSIPDHVIGISYSCKEEKLTIAICMRI